MADDEDFEPQEFSVNKSDKWEGEDEDDNDVKARGNFLSSYFKHVEFPFEFFVTKINKDGTELTYNTFHF